VEVSINITTSLSREYGILLDNQWISDLFICSFREVCLNNLFGWLTSNKELHILW
jgi:hypothetical protein